MSTSTLRELRQQSGMSVRAVAAELGFDTHSKYAYYESARFKGPLPLALAKDLAKMWSGLGVKPEDVLAIAGLNRDQALQQYAMSRALKYQPSINLRVMFPDEHALSLMFDHIFLAIGRADLVGELSSSLAALLPTALESTPTWKDDPDRDRLIDYKTMETLKRKWEDHIGTPF